MQIFDALANFHRSRDRLSRHYRRISAARRAADPQKLASLHAETAELAMAFVDAASVIAELLDSEIDPAAWRQFLKAAGAQAATNPAATVGSMAAVVAAVEGAQLICALGASA
jgi:hypothetical protein